MLRWLVGVTACGLAGVMAAGPVSAAPGDTYRVSAERVNLRAGPTDTANVRGQVLQGEQLLELRRDGNWYGVRVLRTGEEGWIFGDLIQPVTPSTLGIGGGPAALTAGFGDLSRDFDRLMGTLGQRAGLSLASKVSQREGNTLEVTLTPDWLRAGSTEEHLFAASAIYQMWKNHQNSAPVRVVLVEPNGDRYITIDETGPAEQLLTIADRRD